MSQLEKTIDRINSWSHEEAKEKFFRCCSSKRWAETFSRKRPFQNFEEIQRFADEIWFSLTKSDWLEAFSHHPRIGGDLKALREKFQSTKGWSSQEQSGVDSAKDETLLSLQKGNLDYEKKFGHVFLICATGKSAEEMLEALKVRLPNSAEQELKNAAIEQSKITRIRLKKLLEEE